MYVCLYSPPFGPFSGPSLSRRSFFFVISDGRLVSPASLLLGGKQKMKKMLQKYSTSANMYRCSNRHVVVKYGIV